MNQANHLILGLTTIALQRQPYQRRHPHLGSPQLPQARKMLIEAAGRIKASQD